MAKAAEKKPNFPFKVCPKCGNYIHTRSKSHEACGWTEASSPASKPEAKIVPTPSNGEKLSKMEAVRRVLKEHGKDAKPLDIQGYLKTQHSIKMDTGTISNYKNTILKDRKKHGQRKGHKAWLAKAGAAESISGISLEDIKAVKHLTDTIGAEKVRALAIVLAK